MSFATDGSAEPTAKRWLAAILVAVLLAAALLIAGPVPRAMAASCNGQSHTPSLSGGTVSPGSGGPSTDFDFSVVYSDSAGCAPSSVVVVISGVGPIAMTASGSNWQAGVTFTVSRNLAVGSYAYSFSATSGSGGGTKTVTLSSVSPGTIVVAPPTPKPTPKPTAKPKPKPAATARPRSTTKPKPKPTQQSTATPGATPDPTSTETAAFDPDPPASQPPIAIVFGPGPIDRGGPSVGSSGPSLPGGVGGLGGGPFDQFPWLWSVLLTTFSAIVGIVLFIWLASRPRRRYAELGPGPMDPRDIASPMPQLPAGPALVAMAAAAVPDTPYGEMEMPRWRRPSLQAARKASTRDIPAHIPMVFAAAAEATEQRARVTYRLVRVYDQPDEVRGTEVAWLDRGDEVDVVAQQGSYTFVQTPSGAAGWVHKTTLKAIQDDEDETAFGGSDAGEDDPPSWSIIH